MKKIILTLFLLACGIIDLDLDFSFEDLQEGLFPISASAAVSQAVARPYHRQSRRVARRTSRRYSYRSGRGYYYGLPYNDCYWYSSYYNCRGRYYQPVIEDGTTAYVITN